MLVDLLQKAHGLLRIVDGAVKQSFGGTFDERQGRAQFVAHVADEFRADVFQFLEPRDFVKNKQLPFFHAWLAGDDGGVDLPAAPARALDFQFGVKDAFFSFCNFAASAANSCQRKASMMVWPRTSAVTSKNLRSDSFIIRTRPWRSSNRMPSLMLLKSVCWRPWN
jgi:hypothetical protein